MTPNPQTPIDSQIQALLEHAEQLLTQRQPQDAARLFAQAAGQLESDHPRRAANAHAQAAHAYADSGNEAEALAQSRAALSQFMALGMNDRTPVFYANITRKLGARSMAAAQTLQQEFGAGAGDLETLGAAPLDQVARANRLLANGKLHQAAALLAQSAQDVAARFPRRAANLHAQAAHAYADHGDESAALQQARLALNQFLQLEMVERAPAFYTNITRKMRNKGQAASADLLQHEFGNKLRAEPGSATGAPKRGRLPGTCQKCGGPARSDEVDWIDDQSAACTYCGSVLQTIT